MIIASDLAQIVQAKAGVLMKLVAPYLRNKNTGIISVSTAVALALFYAAFQNFNRPPRALRHLPYIGYFTLLKYCLKDELFENYSNKVVMPIIKESKSVYVRKFLYEWNAVIVDPLIAKKILFKPEHVFRKMDNFTGSAGTIINGFIGGPNIAFVNGDDWKRHRKIANPAFGRSMPIKIFGQLTKKMYETIDQSGSDTIDVMDLFGRWALDAIGIAGFDFDFNALGDKNSEWVHYYNSIMKGMNNPLFIFFPAFETKYLHLFKKRKQVHDNLNKFLSNMDEIIDQKRKLVKKNISTAKDEEKDLLTLMIESELNESGGQTLTNEELRSNLCVFFLAGHDTTANTLAFALYELAINPELQEKARKEAIQILGDAPEDVIPTAEQIKNFTYINMIIKETLRRHCPVYNVVSRIAPEDLDFNGHIIPKGSKVTIDLYHIHHNPEVWNDPYKFNPERFAAGGEAEQQKGVAWVPFSNGTRQCIGMNFSLAEQRVVLSMMLRKFKWTLPADSPHKNFLQKKGIAWILVVIKDKLNITFEKRY